MTGESHSGGHLSALDPKRWGTTANSACSVCDGPVEGSELHQGWISLVVATDVLPLLVNACRPPASPRCWAHSVSYASSCAASSRHAAEKAASLVPVAAIGPRRPTRVPKWFPAKA